MDVDRIMRGDALSVLKTLPPDSIDAIVSDPPYGMKYQSSWRTDKFAKIHDDDNLAWVPSFLSEAYRVLKPNTHIYLFCNDYAISDFRRELEAVGFTPKRTLVWVKNNHTSGDLLGDYANKTEFIVFAQKGRRLLNGRRDTNVLEFKRISTLTHPTQKPVDLCAFLISKSSNQGDLVLDPFLGSGTTAVAAKQLGRHFIGIEREPEYVKIAEQRLAGVQKPLLSTY